ncbi:hypothetical protein [Pseudoalteromonas aurantia]|nr:hypothetical protein [Pseudoalteromonas aurantia]
MVPKTSDSITRLKQFERQINRNPSIGVGFMMASAEQSSSALV